MEGIDKKYHHYQQGDQYNLLENRFSGFSFWVDGLHAFLLEQVH